MRRLSALFALIFVSLSLPVAASTPLEDAIWQGDVKKVAALIRAKADVNQVVDTMTPLCQAEQQDDGKAVIVEMLIRAGADVNVPCGGRRETALHTAAAEGRVAAVKLLLAAGAHVNARDYQDSTPLYVAADTPSPEVVKLLLDAGAEVDARGVGGNTPLLNAMSNSSGEPARAITELLLAAGADPNASGGYGTPLYAAIVWHRALLIEPLLAAGADPRRASDSSQSALDAARESGDAQLVALLERTKPAARKRDAMTAKLTPAEARAQLAKLGFARIDGAFLIERLESNDAHAAQLLLAAGVSPNVTDSRGQTALKVAIDSKDAALVAALLDAGADPNDAGHVVVQGAELRESPVVAAVTAGDAEILRLLLAHGAKPDAKTIYGENALMDAALAGREDLVRLLVEAKADVNVEDRTGVPVLWNAVQSRKPAVVKLLLDHGAVVGSHRKVLMDAAKESGDAELVAMVKAAP